MECKLFFPNLTFHQRQGTIINNKRHNTVCSRYIHNETICLLNGKVSLRRPELRTETELQAAVRGFASCFISSPRKFNAASHHALFHSHYPCRLFTESFTQPSDFKSQRQINGLHAAFSLQDACITPYQGIYQILFR